MATVAELAVLIRAKDEWMNAIDRSGLREAAAQLQAMANAVDGSGLREAAAQLQAMREPAQVAILAREAEQFKELALRFACEEQAALDSHIVGLERLLPSTLFREESALEERVAELEAKVQQLGDEARQHRQRTITHELGHEGKNRS